MMTVEESGDSKRFAIKFMESVIERSEKLECKEKDRHRAELKRIKDSRYELVNYYQKQVAYYEKQASHARILRVCLTGKP